MSEQSSKLNAHNPLFPFLISSDMNPYFIEGQPPYQSFSRESKVRIQEGGSFIEQNRRRLTDLGMVAAQMVGPDAVGLGIKNMYECNIEPDTNKDGEISTVHLTRGPLKPALADLRLFVEGHTVEDSLQTNIGNIEYPHQHVALSLYPYEQVMQDVSNPANLPALVRFGIWNHGYTFDGASALNDIRIRALETIEGMSPEIAEQLRQCVLDQINWKEALMKVKIGGVSKLELSHSQIPVLKDFLYCGTV